MSALATLLIGSLTVKRRETAAREIAFNVLIFQNPTSPGVLDIPFFPRKAGY